jgi:hypothetical protein
MWDSLERKNWPEYDVSLGKSERDGFDSVGCALRKV